MARFLAGRSAVLLVALALATACDAENDGPGGMSATLDGVAFASDQYSNATASDSPTGSYRLIGSRIGSGSTGQAIILNLYNIGGPGTYPLGVNATNVGGVADIEDDPAFWHTPLSGAAGTVTVTTLTSARIAGTFSFTALNPLNARSQRTVSAGRFDLTVHGTPGTVQPNQGNKLSATIGGAAWNGATVLASASGGTYTLTATSAGTYALTFVVSSAGVPGTFPLGGTGATTTLVASTAGGAWYSYAPDLSTQVGDPSGSVVLSSIDGNRIRGTFQATLSTFSSKGGTDLSIANGTFDLGL